jgi:uncharacterized SAM-binding protein YcdF (DUF218 family)
MVERDSPPPSAFLRPVARGLALFFGAFTFLNLAGGRLAPNFDANLWWVDLRAVPAPLAGLFLSALATLLLFFAVRPATAGWRRAVTLATVAAALAACLANGICFYVLLWRGAVRSGLPIPLSFVLAAALSVVLAGVACGDRRPPSRHDGLVAGSVFAFSLILFPLLQMACFGKTDYRRAADVIIVFGARTYADGRPSAALADRVRTACRLYQEGYAPRLVFSGGPGDGAVHETEAMRNLAIELGVPAERIALDRSGLNTRATVANTAGLLRQGKRRALAVSHFYHLPRVKLAYQRAGCEVYTVPAQEEYTLSKMPYLVAREVAALWAYYFAGAGPGSLSTRGLAG